MLMKYFVSSGFMAAALVAGLASGEDYPSRPIRIITGSAGGGNDLVARMIVQGISAPLGQQVVVENRPNVVGVEIASRANPDGYTLLIAGDLLWIQPLLRKMSYDALRDFSPVSMLGSNACLVLVHPSVPAKSIKDLIALAKAKPGVLNYGTSTPGGTPHLGMAMFVSMSGVNMVPVNYKGVSDIGNALIANEVQMGVIGTGPSAGHVKSGRLRPLAVTSLKPSVHAPGMPTVSESGLPGYEVIGIDAMYVPGKTPATIINRLNAEIVRYLNTAEAKEKYLSFGSEVIASSPKEHLEKLKSQMSRIGKVLKDAGITAEQ